MRRVGLLASAVLAAGCGGGGEALLPEGRALAAAPALEPAVHLFGDPVVARLDVVVDRRLLDPDRLEARAEFGPYERVGPPRRSRRDAGHYTRLRYEFTLRCLELACVSRGLAGSQVTEPGGRRTFRFPAARLLSEGRLLRPVAWPPLETVSRINTAQTAGRWFPFRASTTPLPERTYRAAPPVLAAGFLLAALALLTVPARAGWRLRRARRPQPVAEDVPRQTPLERALALVEEASTGDEPARRRALQLLADELEGSDAAALAEHATELAWSRSSPAPEAIAELVERVREVDGRTV